MVEKDNNIGCCGHDCGRCVTYLATVQDDDGLRRQAQQFYREAFRTDLRDTTKIIIAQRIGSVKDADRIVVMNEGRVTGVGTHEALLADNAEYREIYESQTDKKSEEVSDDGKKS